MFASRSRRPALALLACMVLAPTAARAQITEEPANPLPDPSKFARGLHADAEVGSLFFIGDAQRPLGAGLGFGVRVGWDVFRWLGVQLHGFGSTHETNFRNLPTQGELLQVYQGTAEVKLAVPIGRLSLVGYGGAGLAHFSTNLVELAGIADGQTTTVLTGGTGLDYHTLSRHVSFGLLAAFGKYAGLRTTGGVSATTYLRYAF